MYIYMVCLINLEERIKSFKKRSTYRMNEKLINKCIYCRIRQKVKNAFALTL